MFYKKKYVTAGNLAKVIDISEEHNVEMYEILYRPVETKKNKLEILSTIDSLCGISSDSGMSLEDYKKERLEKYEIVN